MARTKTFSKDYYHLPHHKAKQLARVKRLRERNAAIIREAKSAPCVDCGVIYPHYVMDLDHRDSKTKSFTLGGSGCRSEQRIRNEIAKCDVVCANCHRERTQQRLKS